MNNILIIIPAYNEEETIYSTVTRLISLTDYDYVVINDGSTDNTGNILEENHFNHIDLPCNLGIGGAMQTGYKYALNHGYECAIQLDADGQHNPKDLRLLVDEISKNDLDMVIGSRFVEKTSYRGSLIRRIGIHYFYLLIKFMTGIRVKDPTSGYRIVNRKIIKEFAQYYPIDYPEVEVLVDLARKKYRIKEIKVEMSGRQGGVSSISKRHSIYYMSKVSLFSLIRRVF